MNDRTANIEPPPKPKSRLLFSMKGAIVVQLFLVALPVISLLFRQRMASYTGGRWQISGYYLDVTFYGTAILLGALWVAILCVALKDRPRVVVWVQALAVPLVLLLATGSAVVCSINEPLEVASWPIATMHVPNQDKWYLLTRNGFLGVEEYRLYSADSTRLNPVWKLERAWHHNYSFPDNLILSQDQQVLAVSYNNRLVRAYTINQGLTDTGIVPSKLHPEQADAAIRALLDQHAKPPDRH